jgi:uncharacterized membrane protein HdeD (DUF308 family)
LARTFVQLLTPLLVLITGWAVIWLGPMKDHSVTVVRTVGVLAGVLLLVSYREVSRGRRWAQALLWAIVLVCGLLVAQAVSQYQLPLAPAAGLLLGAGIRGMWLSFHGASPETGYRAPTR